MGRFSKRVLAIAATLGILAPVAFAPAARGEDAPVGKVAEFSLAIDAHIGLRDTDALTADVKAIAKYAAQASDAKERAVLTNLVGRAIKVTDDPLRLACLKAFQDMKDPSAWTWFAFLVSQPDKNKMDPMLAEAIKTCGELTPEGAALPLISIYHNSEAIPACIACLKALSKYKNSKQRANILSNMIGEVKSIKPGVFGKFGAVHTSGRSGEAARTRWDGLSGPVVENANALTGQSIGTIDDWIKTWDDMKSTLEQCFMEPIAKPK